jgi:hypothetical protein
MTSDVADMSSPVTRGELRDELAQLEHRIERKFDDKLDRLERKFDDKFELLDSKFERLESKFDNNLGLWGGALAAQISELATQTSKLATQTSELATQISESETRMLNEIARHTQAVFESMTRQISAVDEKYNDLPRAWLGSRSTRSSSAERLARRPTVAFLTSIGSGGCRTRGSTCSYGSARIHARKIA